MSPENQDYFVSRLPGGEKAAEYVKEWSRTGGFYEVIAVDE